MSKYSPRVSVVNRVNETLTGTWNGIQHDCPPGEHYFPEDVAKALRKQNVVMGSENPRTGHVIYKVGIREHNDPITMLTEDILAPYRSVYEKWGERWDRSQLSGAKPSEVVPGDNGIYSARDVAVTLPGNTQFTKP